MAQPDQSATPDPKADMYDLYLSNTKDSLVKKLAQTGAPVDPKARKADLVAQLYDAKTAPQAPPAQPGPAMPPMPALSQPPAASATMPPDPGADQGQSLLADMLRQRLSAPAADQRMNMMSPDQAVDPLQMRLRNAIAGGR